MLETSVYNIIGHADIQRAISLVGKYIDVKFIIVFIFLSCHVK